MKNFSGPAIIYKVVRLSLNFTTDVSRKNCNFSALLQTCFQKFFKNYQIRPALMCILPVIDNRFTNGVLKGHPMVLITFLQPLQPLQPTAHT